jgi:inosine-uridine nucleoside N-ribohydrolase
MNRLPHRISRRLRTASIALALAAALLLATFGVPFSIWRTGEIELPPLAFLPSGDLPKPHARIWIDTDAACGASDTTDPDDCFALLALARAPGIRIAGISTVFGNAPLDTTDATTRRMVELLASEGTVLPAVNRGAHARMQQSARMPLSPAVKSLRQALAAGPLRIIALGPLTNIALALEGQSDLSRNVASLIAVMGRRPGHIFHPSEGRGEGMLFGHGPIFRDFNFAMDPGAVRIVLDLRLALILVPYDAARNIEITQTDIDALVLQGNAARWVAERSRGWLRYWNAYVGHAGFYPLDLLAAAYAIDARGFQCAQVQAWIGKDSLLWHFPFTASPALLVEQTQASEHGVTRVYCPMVEKSLPDTLRRWLVNPDYSAR